jgi:hypothetical protein
MTCIYFTSAAVSNRNGNNFLTTTNLAMFVLCHMQVAVFAMVTVVVGWYSLGTGVMAQ